jgi:hypothetical protein
VRNNGRLVQQRLTQLSRLAADLGHPIAVVELRRDIELDRALVNEKIASSYWTRYCIGSQWRSARTGFMWSDYTVVLW